MYCFMHCYKKYLLVCCFCPAWSKQVPSLHTSQASQYHSVQDQVLQPGPRQNSQCPLWLTQSMLLMLSCWGLYCPGVREECTSWEKECCPLQINETNVLIVIYIFNFQYSNSMFNCNVSWGYIIITIHYTPYTYFFCILIQSSWSRLEHVSLPEDVISQGGRSQVMVS